MTLSTAGTVVLQPFERRHLAQTLAWTNDPDLARIMNRTGPVAPDEHERWFLDLPRRDDVSFWAVEVAPEGGNVGPEGRHVGNVWLAHIDRRHSKAEVRVVVGESGATNKGVGASAIDLIARRAFGVLELHRVYAYVLAINPRARRAFEKAGFSLEGTLRADRVVGPSAAATVSPVFADVFVLGRLAT